MASTWSQLVMVIVVLMWMGCTSSHSQLSFPTSTISAAPSFLPTSFSPTLSPDITPLFPSPAAAAAPSPSESSIPTIPSSPSPPNPDQTLAPEPTMDRFPSVSLPDPGPSLSSSSIVLALSQSIRSVMFLGFTAFWLMQLYGM
ncbi:hypothetical protein CsSME_00042015 [Camellia sinensis var. sinensis]